MLRRVSQDGVVEGSIIGRAIGQINPDCGQLNHIGLGAQCKISLPCQIFRIFLAASDTKIQQPHPPYHQKCRSEVDLEAAVAPAPILSVEAEAVVAASEDVEVRRPHCDRNNGAIVTNF